MSGLHSLCVPRSGGLLHDRAPIPWVRRAKCDRLFVLVELPSVYGLLSVEIGQRAYLCAINIFCILRHLRTIVVTSRVFFGFTICVVFFLVSRRTYRGVFFFEVTSGAMVFSANLNNNNVRYFICASRLICRAGIFYRNANPCATFDGFFGDLYERFSAFDTAICRRLMSSISVILRWFLF